MILQSARLVHPSVLDCRAFLNYSPTYLAQKTSRHAHHSDALDDREIYCYGDFISYNRSYS